MKFEKLESKTVVLPIENIDTDQIIPARYLKSISKEGLGEGLFFDWRYNRDGSPKADFPLNKPETNRSPAASFKFQCVASRERDPA